MQTFWKFFFYISGWQCPMACFTWKNEYYHYIFERVGYLENNVRVSLLIGIQVIPLDWNSSASWQDCRIDCWVNNRRKQHSNMNIFISGFALLSVLCAVLFIYTRTALTTISDAAFKNFQRVYLVVYLLAMGEWTWLLQ